MSVENNGNGNGAAKILTLAIGSLLALGGVTFKLVLERMDKQEMIAAADILQLRAEIKTTKEDAQTAVTRQEAAATAAASVLRDAVASTAKAAKDGVDGSAKALSDSVTATAKTAKDAVDTSASNLEKKIDEISRRVEKLEDRAFSTGTSKDFPK